VNARWKRTLFMNEEVFDVVDACDEVIGQAPRSEVHRRRLNHRAVHVLVFNRRGEVFLQKRSTKKDCFPGVWDSSASGHVDRGEEYDACAVREVREELGVQLPKAPERLFRVAACERTGHEFVWVYRCAHEGPFELHPEEIDLGGWFALGAVDQWTAQQPREFAPAFVLIWERWRSEFRNRESESDDPR
jgi:isopentenyl-diphosphate delta-isomerase